MNSLKKEVIEMVSGIDDNNLLELIKADIEHFKDNKTDILDDLSYEDQQELMQLADEPDEKDTLSDEEFKAITARWRMK